MSQPLFPLRLQQRLGLVLSPRRCEHVQIGRTQDLRAIKLLVLRFLRRFVACLLSFSLHRLFDLRLFHALILLIFQLLHCFLRLFV